MQKVSKMTRALALVLSIGISGIASAEMSREDQSIKVRKGAYSMIAWYYGSMMRMMKGVTPYDQVQFARNAEVLAFLSELPKDAFIHGSDKGDTKARIEIWTHPQEFRQANEQLEAEAAKLAELSKAGDMEVLKAQLTKVQRSCKACHEDFKNRAN